MSFKARAEDDMKRRYRSRVVDAEMSYKARAEDDMKRRYRKRAEDDMKRRYRETGQWTWKV
jgi:hypothetical protein